MKTREEIISRIDELIRETNSVYTEFDEDLDRCEYLSRVVSDLNQRMSELEWVLKD